MPELFPFGVKVPDVRPLIHGGPLSLPILCPLPSSPCWAPIFAMHSVCLLLYLFKKCLWCVHVILIYGNVSGLHPMFHLFHFY